MSLSRFSKGVRLDEDLGRVTPGDPPVLIEDPVERHHGPGPHPGTGTDQSVHAGNGSKGYDPYKANHIVAGLPGFWTHSQEKLDLIAGAARRFAEVTGIEPKDIYFLSNPADIEGILPEDMPISEKQDTTYLIERRIARARMAHFRGNYPGTYGKNFIMLNYNLLTGPYQASDSEKSDMLYHEMGHWTHTYGIDGESATKINRAIQPGGRYLDTITNYYGSDASRNKKEYVADLIAAWVREPENPSFHRWGLGYLNRYEREDLQTIKDILADAEPR